MAEWPKRVLEWQVPGERDEDGEEIGIAVIPADLGRELYEALVGFGDRWTTSDGVKCDCTTCTQTRASLARYEREVGT